MAPRKKPGDRANAIMLAGHRRIATARGDWVRTVISGPDGTTAQTVRMLDNDTLGLMLERKMVTLEQWAWGERLREDWYNAGMAASGVPDLERPVVDVMPDYEATMVRQDEYRRRYALALKAVGLVHSAALRAVVIENQRLVDYGRRRFGLDHEASARSAARAVVAAALEQLGEYYRHGLAVGQRTRQDARKGGGYGNDC